MNKFELESLYRTLERFIAETPRDEYERNEQSIKSVQAMIHRRMQMQ